MVMGFQNEKGRQDYFISSSGITRQNCGENKSYFAPSLQNKMELHFKIKSRKLAKVKQTVKELVENS